MGSNSTFKLFRRGKGQGDDAWVETGETFRDGDDVGRDESQRLPLECWLTLRELEDGFEYKAEPV